LTIYKKLSFLLKLYHQFFQQQKLKFNFTKIIINLPKINRLFNVKFFQAILHFTIKFIYQRKFKFHQLMALNLFFFLYTNFIVHQNIPIYIICCNYHNRNV
jgi:hypothetical protein